MQARMNGDCSSRLGVMNRKRCSRRKGIINPLGMFGHAHSGSDGKYSWTLQRLEKNILRPMVMTSSI